MICAASIHVGPAQQTFWAVFERTGTPDGTSGAMAERTRMIPRRGALDLTPGRLRIRDDAISARPRTHRRRRYRSEVPQRQRIRMDAQASRRTRPRPTDPRRLSADRDRRTCRDRRHRRLPRTRDGVVVGRRGRRRPGRDSARIQPRAGRQRPASGSERAIWVAGVPHEAPPVRFSADLRSISSEDGSQLRFAPEAERSRRENLLLVRSDYRAPFGTFSGKLPGGIELTHALGVVEHHRARW